MNLPAEMETRNGLPAGWEAKLGLNGRLYYYSKRSQIVQILPPTEVWRCAHNLPYGWEMAIDYDNKNYYINHITQTVTHEDPRTEDDQSTPCEQFLPADASLSPQPRECEITRDPQMGFGFIAGSEKPVVIRSVTPGGPSEGILLPDDRIVKIGSENVMMANRERVVELIREKSDKVVLTVLQPNRSASSSFLNPAKKTFRTMDRPKVRFADDVIVNGQERTEGYSSLLVSPEVLRVELENKQTRSFRFQSETTVGDAVAALCDKLGFKDPNLFSLVLTPPVDAEKQNAKNGKSFFRVSSSTLSDQQPFCSSSPDSVLVAPWDCLAKVVNNPFVRYHSCFLRLEFMPKDFHDLTRNDPEAFQYLYQQCVNDVVSADAYKNDLSREELVKLAVIQMQELVLTSMPSTPPDKVQKKSLSFPENSIQRNAFRFSGISNKLTLKYIEKEYGLRRFLPPSVMSIMRKDNPTARNLRKSLQQYLKASYSTSFFSQHPTSPIIPTSPILTSGGNSDAAILQLRLQYLKILSPQHIFGGRYFSASMQALMESDITILVGHNYGISQMINAKTRMVSVLAGFRYVTGFEVAPCQVESSTTTVRIQFSEKKELVLTMAPHAAHTFAFMVAGYCRVYGNIDMVLTLPIAESTSAPIYFGPHKVKPSYWNYPPARSKNDVASDSALDTTENGTPYYIYCDFSEPITSAVLSQEMPVLTIPQKNYFHRPPTPPHVFNSSIEGDEARDELAENSVILSFEEELKPDSSSSSDSNNNNSFRINSHEATYEEINSPLSESPVSSMSAEQSPSSSMSNNQSEMPTYNGYLVPTPPRSRNKRVVAEVEEIRRDCSEGEGDWMDLMKVLGNTGDNNGEKKFVDRAKCSQENLDDFPAPPSPHIKVAGRGQMIREIVVPPPPNYPPPKRKESLRKDGDKLTQKSKSNSLGSKTFSGEATFKVTEAVQKASTIDGRNSALSKVPSKHMSSFKPNKAELNVFSLTRSDLGHNMATSTSGSTTGSTPASVVGTPVSKTLGCLDDVQDPVTRRKLQETDDLIEYFRRKREEIVGSPSGNDATNKDGLRDEIVTPIVVSDIAAGNKRLRKAEKAASKNRKSWAASETLTSELILEDQGPISRSIPDLTSTSLHKKRNKSLFRRLFGDRKQKSHSMYEVNGTPSAYGRRKRRFRFPKLRLRRAFTLSSKKENRKSVLPFPEEETLSQSNHFRFRPFSHKKSTAKSPGVFVISEPCDDVRGVDMLPSGKYTIAGTMFQANGDASETEIITLDSKRPSRESLVDKNEMGGEESEPSLADDPTGVTRRANSTRETQRPVSFSTFQQAVLEGYADLATPKLTTVDEAVRGSLPDGMDMDQPSPCELSQTESSEALQEIMRSRDGNIHMNHGEIEFEFSVSKLLHQDIPPRKLVPVVNPVVSAKTARKPASLPPGVHLGSVAPRATSTPIEGSKKLIKKRPSNKRPAPPPPVMKRIIDLDGATDENDWKRDKTGGRAGEYPQDDLKNDWDEDTLFKRKSVESPSLVNEILSYLESSNSTRAEADKSNLLFVEADVLTEPALPYDEDYVMPGMKSTSAMDEGNKPVAENEYENDETRQRRMYEILYDEMVKDHSRLTLENDGSLSERDGASDGCDSEGHGQKVNSYDVTFSDEITTDDVMKENNEERESTVLKSYGKFEDGNSSWTNEEEGSVTSSTNDIRYVGDVTDQKTDSNSSGIDSNVGYINLKGSRNPPGKMRGSYVAYQNLVSPSRYSRGFAGAKRTSFTKKPPLPPKPIFH